MNAAHLHLIVNHVSVIVIVLSVMLLIWSFINKNVEYQKLALIGFVIAAIFAYITFESGENAEDIVEDLAGFSHDLIEDHEHAADTARLFALILGVAGIGGLFFGKKNGDKQWYKIFIFLTLGFALVTIGYLAYTGYLGGLIQHEELSSAALEINDKLLYS